jgi:NTE family protein
MKNKFSFCFTFMLIYSIALLSQSKQINNLAFEGAGIRGLAYCGAIKALEQNGSLKNVKRIAGTSAGAITALLLSINYTSSEIETIISSTNFRKFNDGGVPLFGGTRRLIKSFGWYKGDKFERWLGKLIAQKTGNANITFAEIAQKYTALFITGTNLSEQKLVIFSAENFPNMPVKNAVRISMSIPLYYKAVCMDDAGMLYKKQNKKNSYHIMVDVGLMCNFPIHIFDSTKYMDTTKVNTFAVNPYTVGCRIDNKHQIDLDKNTPNTTLAPIQIENIGSYFNAFLTLITERLNRQSITSADWSRTISIPDGDIGPKVKK